MTGIDSARAVWLLMVSFAYTLIFEIRILWNTLLSSLKEFNAY